MEGSFCHWGEDFKDPFWGEFSGWKSLTQRIPRGRAIVYLPIHEWLIFMVKVGWLHYVPLKHYKKWNDETIIIAKLFFVGRVSFGWFMIFKNTWSRSKKNTLDVCVTKGMTYSSWFCQIHVVSSYLSPLWDKVSSDQLTPVAAYVRSGLNSHYFHIIGDGHQPNSRGLYTHYKDSLLKVGWPSPTKRDFWPWHI